MRMDIKIQTFIKNYSTMFNNILRNFYKQFAKCEKESQKENYSLLIMFFCNKMFDKGINFYFNIKPSCFIYLTIIYF